MQAPVIRARIDGVARTWRYVLDGRRLHLASAGADLVIEALSTLTDSPGAANGAGGATAPMAGKLVALLVAAGDRVTKGQPLATLEAMKMEHDIRADRDGLVLKLAVAVGDLVAARAMIMEIG